MSYTIKIVKGIDSFLSLVENKMDDIYKYSLINKFFKKVLGLFKGSFIWRWFKKPEKEARIFSTSKVLKGGAEIVDRFARTTKTSKYSSFHNIIKNNISTNPLSSLSIVIFAAVITNLSFYLFSDYTFKGIVVRTCLVFLSFIGIFIRDYKSMVDDSKFIRWVVG